jgi:hypothetical protein
MKNIFELLAAISKDEVNLPKADLNSAQFDSIIGGIFGIAGAVAVIFVILGGFRYAISQGNATDLQKGKDIIIYALVGLVFVIFSFTIIQFVTGKLF